MSNLSYVFMTTNGGESQGPSPVCVFGGLPREETINSLVAVECTEAIINEQSSA